MQDNNIKKEMENIFKEDISNIPEKEAEEIIAR